MSTLIGFEGWRNYNDFQESIRTSLKESQLFYWKWFTKRNTPNDNENRFKVVLGAFIEVSIEKSSWNFIFIMFQLCRLLYYYQRYKLDTDWIFHITVSWHKIKAVLKVLSNSIHDLRNLMPFVGLEVSFSILISIMLYVFGLNLFFYLHEKREIKLLQLYIP